MSVIVSIIGSSATAMMKLLLISIVGIISARYPKNEPILPPSSLRYLSRLSNIVLTPCLILSSLGGTINFELFQRIGILTLFCFIINILSFLLCDYVGYYIHGESNGNRESELYITIRTAVGNGNAISLPILVMQILCEDKLINHDYNDDAGQCYHEASSMIFVYMIMWFVMFWGYGFPTLQQLKYYQDNNTSKISKNQTNANLLETNGNIGNMLMKMKENLLETWHYLLIPENQHYLFDKIQRIVYNPAMIAVMISLCIGFISPIQQLLFTGSLSVVGASIETIGQPVVALNCLIMAASLAHCNFPVNKIKHYIDTCLFDDVNEETNGTNGNANGKKDGKGNNHNDVVQNELHPITNNTSIEIIAIEESNHDIESHLIPTTTTTTNTNTNTNADKPKKHNTEPVSDDEEEAEEEENNNRIQSQIEFSLTSDGIPYYPTHHHSHHSHSHRHHHHRNGHINSHGYKHVQTIIEEEDDDDADDDKEILQIPTKPQATDAKRIDENDSDSSNSSSCVTDTNDNPNDDNDNDDDKTLPPMRSVLALLISR